jgi:hypothetical protein
MFPPGQPRQNISPEGMSAPDQITANCCTAVSGVPGQKLSLVYAEPFASSGRYYDFGELLQAAGRARLTYGHPGRRSTYRRTAIGWLQRAIGPSP